MPSETTKRTKKHGRQQRIKLYADERNVLTRAALVLDQLAACNTPDRPKLVATAENIRTAREMYTDYHSNGKGEADASSDTESRGGDQNRGDDHSGGDEA